MVFGTKQAPYIFKRSKVTSKAGFDVDCGPDILEPVITSDDVTEATQAG